ncbi:MAG: malto-oligosyltrehalose synthase [Acidimicrobiia bacterium]|nr:malto-oligosyltrehalose synthase [Acidimicrobiia bacterium]
MSPPPLLATYRVQLTPGFGFREVAELADYLAALGATHLYSSPQLQAAPGSTHGYDVVDHSHPSAVLGGPDAHREMTAALAAAGLGHIVDIVPNHMAITGPENRWWWDVLENGQASRFSDVFDVEWGPPESGDRILLPVLGDHYVRVLAAGELHVAREGGAFTVRYYDHRFPVSPRALDVLLDAAAESCDSDELAFLAGAHGALPAAGGTDGGGHARRHRDKEVLRSLLDHLLATNPRTGEAIDGVVAELNADPEALDQLLGRQNYRLAHWRTAGQELDYRRFFDVSTLAGLRTEDERVFADTHRLVLAWHREGRLEGLRVDHPDGLRDPAGYLERLTDAANGAWVTVEKVLVGEEVLAPWPVAGTTGYEFLNLVLGLFVDPAAADPFGRLHEELTGEEDDYDGLVARCKRLVLEQVLGADLQRLTERFAALCGEGRRYGDYARGELRAALAALLVAFPVYRTYVRPRPEGGVEASDADRAVLAGATERAKADHPEVDPELFDLLQAALLLDLPDPEAVELSARFQQLSGSVMAKGVEDTTFYRYTRFVAVNEVGGEPRHLGVAPERFHAHNHRVAERWPATMTTTSTHDTKRSEDVRARLALLSEIPARWTEAVRNWVVHNAPKWGDQEPDRSIEHLLYQTLVGAHPLPRDRAVAYLAKAAREAKAHTSWLAADAEYEAALERFVEAVLADERFLADLHAFVEPLVAPGRVNSLAQLLLKLMSPGVPDLYQGTELWDDSLVDPDNRRPVDFAARRALLAELDRPAAAAAAPSATDRPVTATSPVTPEAVLARAEEGLPKLWVVRHALAVRRDRPECFVPGAGYEGLAGVGSRAGHVVALARSPSGNTAASPVEVAGVVAVVPRLVLSLAGDWADTTLDLPRGHWRDELTGTEHDGGPVALDVLLGRFPVALLVRG